MLCDKKCIDLSVISVGLLTMNDSVTSCIGHLKNICFLRCVDRPNVDTFPCTIQKNHICYYHYRSHQKSL